MSKDPGSGASEADDMGALFDDYETGLLSTKIRLQSLSQEHGIVSSALPVGKRVRILPNHSCLTVACFDHCVAVRGNQVMEEWRIWNGR